MLSTTDLCTIDGMNAIDIGAKIAKLRKQKGLSQSELARALDIKPQAVQKWESGGSGPKASRLADIANVLSVGITDLVKGTVYEYIASAHLKPESEPNQQKDDRSGVLALVQPSDDKKDSERTWGRVPLISWEKAGMWAKQMIEISSADVREWIEIPNAVKDAFCLRVEDESAVAPAGQKSYAPGEIVAVDPHKEPKNRSTVVVALKPGARAVLRQILTDGDRTLFRTINPEWPDRFVEKTEGVELIGVVTGKWVPEE